MSFFSPAPTPMHYDSGRMDDIGVQRIAPAGRPRDTKVGKPVLEFEHMYSLPNMPITFITLWGLYQICLPWKWAVGVKIQEKYRRGIDVEPMFSAICEKCESKQKGTGIFQDTTPDQPCPNCAGKLRGPDPSDRLKGMRWIDDANLNHEMLKDVMEQSHEDICVIDNGFILVRKDYFKQKGSSSIKYYKVKEIVSASAIVIRPVVNHQTGTPGGWYWACPNHRTEEDIIKRIPQAEQAGGASLQTKDEVSKDPPKCKKCGLTMQDVKFVSVFHERGRIENYYIDGEIVAWKEYSKGHTYTMSPGVTLWVPAGIITYKDAYIRDSFMKQRKPRGAVVVNTANPEGFMRNWDRIMERVKNDWQYMPVIPMEPEPGMPGAQNRVSYVDFMGSMSDLDYLNIRRDYERQIFMFYGVPNVFANLEEKGGASNVEKTLISNRHVERSNTNENEKPLRLLSLMVGMREHRYKINPFEDKDELKEGQIQMQNDAIMQVRQSMGYEPEFDFRTGEWKMRKDPQRELHKAMDMMNALLSLKSGNLNMQPDTGGVPEGSPAMKPKVDSSEPSGSAVEKALADKQVHEGDSKGTPASSRKPEQTRGAPAGGYYAPDGTGPFKSKQALGGYMRTKDSNSANPQGGQPGMGGDDMMGMEQGHSKEDYQIALKLVRKTKSVSDYILDMLGDMIEEMDEEVEMNGPNNVPSPGNPASPVGQDAGNGQG